MPVIGKQIEFFPSAEFLPFRPSVTSEWWREKIAHGREKVGCTAVTAPRYYAPPPVWGREPRPSPPWPRGHGTKVGLASLVDNSTVPKEAW